MVKTHVFQNRAVWFQSIAVFVALLLLGPTRTGNAQNKLQNEYGFISRNAVINFTVPDSVYVGYSSVDDAVSGIKNRPGPTVRLERIGKIGGELVALNRSTLFVNGGSVGGNLDGSGESHVLVSGGSVAYSLVGRGHSKVTMSGGNGARGLFVTENSTVTISGGRFTDNVVSYVTGSGTLFLKGGSLSGHLFCKGKRATINVSGGSVGGKLIIMRGKLHLFGTGLKAVLHTPKAGKKTAAPSPPVDYVHFIYTQYALFGRLRDGTTVSNRPLYVDHRTGQFTIHNAVAPGRKR